MNRTAVKILSLYLLFQTTPRGVCAESSSYNSPAGIGTLMGNESDGNSSYAIIIEGANHFQQRQTWTGYRQYGFAQSRLELGNHWGVTLSALSGVTVVGLDSTTRDGITPHLGLELFNGRLAWNSGDSRESYYEWLPMLAVGLQLGLGGCRALAQGRAGAAAGNLGKSGLLPEAHWASGAGLNLNCARFDLGGEITRIFRDSPADLAALDISFAPVDAAWRIGLRAEALSLVSSSGFLSAPDDRAERRVMLVFRGNPFAGL